MIDCIFCQIVAGEIPAKVVYEDDSFLAFMDINPVSKGHVQVIPKEHHRWVYDVPNVGEYFEVASKIANGLKKALGVEMVYTFVAGDEVPHAHIWLVPDNEVVEGALAVERRLEVSAEELEQLQQRIRTVLI